MRVPVGADADVRTILELVSLRAAEMEALRCVR